MVWWCDLCPYKELKMHEYPCNECGGGYESETPNYMEKMYRISRIVYLMQIDNQTYEEAKKIALTEWEKLKSCDKRPYGINYTLQQKSK